MFHERLETLFDYVPGAKVSFDHHAEDVVKAALRADQANITRPASKDSRRRASAPTLQARAARTRCSSTPKPGGKRSAATRSCASRRLSRPKVRTCDRCTPRRAKASQLERQNPDINVFDAVVAHIRALQIGKRRVIVATWTPGARERLRQPAGRPRPEGRAQGRQLRRSAGPAGRHRQRLACSASKTASRRRLSPSSANRTSWATAWCGRAASTSAPPDVLTEATSLSVGRSRRACRPRHRPLRRPEDDHGAGRAARLPRTHLCRRRQAVPAGREHRTAVALRLGRRRCANSTGSAAAPGSRARPSLKKRIREIASELIKIAALRQLNEAPAVSPPAGAYDEFVARFPYEETEDQAASIDAVLDDLASGRPMDRLVCGDVGFGKTEVALRAAFVAALNGMQVAVVVPTTLLARQHFKTFSERFQGLPVKVAQASRLVPAKELTEVKAGLEGRQRSTSSSARTRCSARRSSSSASACSSSTRSSTSASPTRSG